MPRGDGTGPAGRGPASGRGAGYCTGSPEPGFTTSGGGGRLRRNRRNIGSSGGGYGNRRVYRETGIPGWIRFVNELLTSRNDGGEDNRDRKSDRAAGGMDENRTDNQRG